MTVSTTEIERHVSDAKATIERIEQAGRSVPEWAITELTLAKNVLEAQQRGDDPSHALGVLLTFKDGNRDEKRMFFEDPTLDV